MKQSLQLKIGQSLTMTPQLQQAIKLLQLSSLELQSEIQQNLDSNPMLEQEDDLSEVKVSEKSSDSEDITNVEIPAENVSEDRAQQTLPDELALDTDWDDIYDPNPGPTASQSVSSHNNEDFADLFENQAKPADELYEHLTWQLECAHLTDTDRAVGRSIIDGIDERGYLTESLEEIHQGLLADYPDLDLDEVEAMLHFVQQFDPVGVAARNPSECMHIQLTQYPADTPHLNKALALVDRYLDYLASNDYAVLKRRLQASDKELAGIVRLIQTTNPHPGHSISSAHAEYITPDVYVTKANGVWQVRINPDNAPRLKINRTYASLVKRGENSVQNNYLRDHLQEARWFIKSLQSRNDTLLRVANAIVERQQGFFEFGDEAMKPMVLRDIAEELEMHESTISRVTTLKYMHTPRGVLEFKYFFSSHVSTTDGGECSATAIRAIIKKLIAAENVSKPLSDSKMAAILDDQGINVARRTIAKYREAMNIPPSNERKRLF
jgi:RNA polymerase sigma-54 factor